MAQTEEINQSQFDKKVLESKLPALIDFHADWCGPCKIVSPLVEALAEKHKGKLSVFKINVDENPNIASRFHIMSIPTLLFIKKGEVFDQQIGVPTQKDLERKINHLINLN